MIKNKTKILAIALSVLMLAGIAPFSSVNAADPTVINDVWFVVMQTSAVSGAASTLNDIYNSTGATIYASILRSPPGTQGSTVIGNATTRIDLLFNNVTKQGLATISMTLNFSDVNVTRNPYGVGVIQAKATNVAVTSLFPSANPGVGNASGTLVSTSGTGAFVNVVLVVDFIMTPYPSGTTGPNEAMFFGSHSRVNGRGILTTYYLPPTTIYDAWFVAMPSSAAVTSTNTSTVSGIYSNIGYTSRYGIMRSPPGASGSVQIGTANSTIDVTFDTSNGIGSATVTLTLNFTDTNTTRNPYGVGTLQGKAINVTVTSLLLGTNPIAGNATGFMVANTGTGAFAKALLAEDFIIDLSRNWLRWRKSQNFHHYLINSYAFHKIPAAKLRKTHNFSSTTNYD